MKGAIINISGNWGHFKKPETNNNPLTHDFITKTALIGLIGAVLGIERSSLKPLFPILSKNLLYGVQILQEVKKESWAFKMRYAQNLYEKRPVQMEFLKNPKFAVAIALKGDESSQIFDDFIGAVENCEALYTPVLGLHNCPAILELFAKGNFVEDSGNFTTKSFVTTKNHDVLDLANTKNFRIGLDKIPTYQNDDFWNDPINYPYQQVLYPSPECELSVKGNYFRFTDNSNWVLI